jgi:hypothetical protein
MKDYAVDTFIKRCEHACVTGAAGVADVTHEVRITST